MRVYRILLFCSITLLAKEVSVSHYSALLKIFAAGKATEGAAPRSRYTGEILLCSNLFVAK